MKKIILAALILLVPQLSFAQDKSHYDLNPGKLGKSGISNSVMSQTELELKNFLFDYTMLKGGYFTAGTNTGLSSGSFDDQCQLTFGHPFAMTSYPVFSIDGTWYKFDDYFTGTSDMALSAEGDTLKLTARKTGVLSISFSIFFQKSDSTLRFNQEVTDLDSVPHTIALGFVLDPALGRWGDASVYLSGTLLKESRILQAQEVPSEILMWEKALGAKGLGAALSFRTSPDKIIIGNWADLYKASAPDFDNTVPQMLYDCLVKSYWNGTVLNPGEKKSAQMALGLKKPDFSSAAFLRWDMPQFFALDNGLIFPQKLDTYVEIKKSETINNGSLKVELPSELTSSQTSYSYGSVIPQYQNLELSPRIIYDGKVAEAVVKLFAGTTLVDELHRFVYIPATPVSDSGLVVTIDTLRTSKFPDMSFIFEVEKKDKGTKVTTLTAENVFLYENSSRITNFTFGKDTSGGASKADIVFVLDVTGSMGNEISSVKNNIIEFANSLSMGGTDYQLGLVTFLDVVENVYPFTKDVQAFQQSIAAQFAHGGGDGPENSLQALLDASRFNFRPDSKRMIIWITDANYHENDSYTPLKKGPVTDSLLVKGIVVNAIGETSYKSSFYDPVILATNGNFYDILGNFRDILLDISRMKSSYKYLISYRSAAASGTNEIKLQIRFAGLGGQTTAGYNTAVKNVVEKHLSFYPNPFNPEITFQVMKGDYVKGKIKIFNILGQKVKEFELTGNNMQKVVWNAKNERGDMVGTGFYFAELTLTDQKKNSFTETAKILYLK